MTLLSQTLPYLRRLLPHALDKEDAQEIRALIEAVENAPDYEAENEALREGLEYIAFASCFVPSVINGVEISADIQEAWRQSFDGIRSKAENCAGIRSKKEGELKKCPLGHEDLALKETPEHILKEVHCNECSFAAVVDDWQSQPKEEA